MRHSARASFLLVLFLAGTLGGWLAGSCGSASQDGVAPPDADSGESLSVDLGYIEPGSVHDLEFTVTNDSDRGLAIIDIKPECACTEVLLAPDIVDARSSQSLTVRFEAPDDHLSYSKRIYLHTDDPDRPRITLILFARIGLPLRVEPPELAIGPDEEVMLRVFNDGPEPVRLVYATSDVPAIRISVSRMMLEPGASVVLEVKVNREEVGGVPSGVLTVHTNIPQQRRLRIPWRSAGRGSADEDRDRRQSDRWPTQRA